MPARDVYHYAVKNALIKDGWRITHDEYQIKFKEIRLYADLAAEPRLAAHREGQQIIVEVKSFLGISRVRELESAIGQYVLYRLYLSQVLPDADLYLAVTQEIYRSFLTKQAIQFAINTLNIKLVIVDVEREEI